MEEIVQDPHGNRSLGIFPRENLPSKKILSKTEPWGLLAHERESEKEPSERYQETQVRVVFHLGEEAFKREH